MWSLLHSMDRLVSSCKFLRYFWLRGIFSRLVINMSLHGNINSSTLTVYGECLPKSCQHLGPVYKKPFSFENATFFCAYAFRPHLSDENGHRKRNFLKTLSRVEFFENDVFVFPCER